MLAPRARTASGAIDNRACARAEERGSTPVQTPWFDSAARRRLHHALLVGDAIALLGGFALPLMLSANTGPRTWLVGLGEALLIAIAGLWCMRFQGLWSSRVTSVRAIEVSRVTRAMAMLSVLALVFDRKSSMSIRVFDVVVASVVAWVVIVGWRSAYRSYLAAEHRHGRLISRVVIVGTDRRASELHNLFTIHPELGMRVTAVVGSRADALKFKMDSLWAGDTIDASAIINRTEPEMVILCSADLDPALVHNLTTLEGGRGRIVYVDPGLSRVDLRRMQTTAVAHQPLLQLESAGLSVLELATKRAFDIVVASIVAVVALPVMAVAALAIKLSDGGPILFRQVRVGRNGEPFGMLKFRTMVVDAEARLAALEAANERRGPLFKMESDPRITRIGRLLRATSLDELPQVLNVLGGTMSIVGPRPALPKEVEVFPDELHARHLVRPGITGLWQVEARDNPSFDAYRRFDLFYVENWSLALDLVILLATADHIVLRPLIKWLYRSQVKSVESLIADTSDKAPADTADAEAADEATIAPGADSPALSPAFS